MHTADLRSSLWAATAPPPPDTPPLREHAKADVAIVGGGFAGLSTALHLAEDGASVRLVEAQEPGFGASGRNNGQVIPAYGRHNPDDVVRLFGEEVGERLNAHVGAAADVTFDLIRRHGIDCDAVQEGWIQPAHAPSRMPALRAKAEQWARRGADVEILDAAETERLSGSPVYHGAWVHRRGGNIQPLAYSRGLARAAIAAGASVHGHSPATGIDQAGSRWRVTTPEGSVEADQVVIATNAYTGALWPKLGQTVVPVRSFQIATAPLSHNLRQSVLPGGQGISDSRSQLWAFRYDRDGRLVTSGFPLIPAGARGGMERVARSRVTTVFPQVGDIGIDYVWEGRIAMTRDRLPRYHALAPGVHAIMGWSGRGIALATATGAAMARHIRTGEVMPLPPAPVEPIPLHTLATPLARAMVLLYRWRDARA